MTITSTGKKRERELELMRKSKRAYYARNRERLLKEGKNRLESDPKKVAAKLAVYAATRAGRMVQGECEQKDETCAGTVQYHHPDYGKPLEVTSLCRSHHHRLHEKLRAEGNEDA